MLVTHELNIDLTKPGVQPMVAAVQGEANTRQLAISLFSNSLAWEIPNGATAAVAFLKPDGTKGLYDKLPDGTVATTLSGNTVNAILAPQALTCAGIVLASIIFYKADGDTLATFPFKITVEQNPAAGEQVSNDYYSPSIHDLDQAIKDLEERVDALGDGGSTGSGAPGGNGATYTPHLTPDGELSWTNDKGLLNPAPVNIKGPKGDPGRTPAAGVDYFTASDKKEIVDAVKAAVPLVKVAEQPTFASGVEECTDTTKLYVLPDGFFYAYMTRDVSWQKTLTAEDFEIGGLLSADGTDMDSASRARTALLECSEQMPVKLVCDAVNAKWLVHFFQNGTWLGKNSFTQLDVDNVATVWTTPSDVTHIRIAIAYKTDATITSVEDLAGNFTITQSYQGQSTEWTNTGLAYNQPPDYEERIVALEKALEGVEYGSY